MGLIILTNHYLGQQISILHVISYLQTHGELLYITDFIRKKAVLLFTNY